MQTSQFRTEPTHETRSGTLLIVALLAGLLLTRLYGYLLFHSLLEIFTVAVAWSVFFLAWNARRFLDNHYLLLVGIASLFVGALDALHALAYKGMGVFPGGGANLATEMWIAGRYVASVTFLAAPLWLRRKLNPGVTFAVYAVLLALLVASIFHGIFPQCYIEGVGLTRFKIVSEYVVSLMLLASLGLLFRARAEFERPVFLELAAAIALTMAGELAFTLYEDVYGAANMIGHLLRFTAFYFLYRAIIVTGLVRPYDLLFRNLARSEAALRASDERYRAFLAITSEGICRVEAEPPVPLSLSEDEQVRLLLGRCYIAECNDAYARMHGRSAAAGMIGAKLSDVLENRGVELLRDFVRAGCRSVHAENCFTGARGELRCLAGSLTGVVEDGRFVRAWGVERDVTAVKQAAAERERLIGELQQALSEVKALSGLLPICANCKKIREDTGYWTQVESYIAKRADVSFTHGICPECVRVLYPEYDAGASDGER